MLQESPDSTVILQDTQEFPLLKNMSTTVTISVSASYIEWSLFGTNYTFPITHWRSTAVNTLVKRFHLLPRDVSQYGEVVEDDAGNISQKADFRQKVCYVCAPLLCFIVSQLQQQNMCAAGICRFASSQGCNVDFGKDFEDPWLCSS